MGMDLIPRNHKVEGGHFNWTGWRVLGDLLDQLGCDTREMAGGNDGERIYAATCKRWAKAMRVALLENRIVNVRVENTMYHGGYFESFAVRDKGDTSLKVNQSELKQDDIDWLMETVTFFAECQGCRQC